MTELVVMLAGQIIGVLLGSLILNAPILQWRARILKNWHIQYKDAYIVSIKAVLFALIVGDVAVLCIAFSGYANEEVVVLTGALVGILSWWFAHSNALLKLARSNNALSVKEARSISLSVIGYLIGVWFALGFVVLLVAMLVSSFY